MIGCAGSLPQSRLGPKMGWFDPGVTEADLRAMPSISDTRHALAAWLAPIRHYERHISAAAMIVGFGIDNYAFGRVDRPGTHIVFGAYLTIAITTIAIAHVIQSAADDYKIKRDAERASILTRWNLRRVARMKKAKAPQSLRAFSDPPGPKAFASSAAQATDVQATDVQATDALAIAVPADAPAVPDTAPPEPAPEAKPADGPRDWRRTALLATTQFAIGGLSSGFLVFYGRSAAFASSWLFLLVLAGFLIGNEVFKKYHSRLVFSSLLLFFSLYSYAIFVVPVLTRSIGKIPFLLSGVVAVLAFLLFLRLLWSIGRDRFRESRWPILLGTVVITIAMNVFYFTSLLPPLPLALLDVGIFHNVKHVGDKYVAIGEQQTWKATLGIEPSVMHVVPGNPVSLYSAVFAPVKLLTKITHRWQLYDPDARHWRTLSTVTFPISGGREGGYRAYSIKSQPKPGNWRVDILTEDGRLVGRFRFVVVDVPNEAAAITKTMQ
jgi:hypothetical protein